MRTQELIGWINCFIFQPVVYSAPDLMYPILELELIFYILIFLIITHYEVTKKKTWDRLTDNSPVNKTYNAQDSLREETYR